MRSGTILKRSLFFLLLWAGLNYGETPLHAGGDNRSVPRADVADRFWQADNKWVVRFTTTTAAANTKFCITTGTVLNLTNPAATYGGTFSPTITASTSTTYGGRAYMSSQVLYAASNVFVDLNSVNISTNTSPYLTQGQWFSPDDPVAWEGEVCWMSPSTFTVSGWMFFDKPR